MPPPAMSAGQLSTWHDAVIPDLFKGPGKECPTCGGAYPPDFLVCPRDASPLGVSSGSRDPLLGTVVGATYRLRRALAAGGMGRLYEAEHVRMERRFAVKVLHECYAHEPAANARFEREVRAIARIRSDYVVDVVDMLRTVDGRPCIVAELLEGQDLQRRLDRGGALPLREAVRIARHTCRGLAAAHTQGIVHRDLKPSNIFLTRGADGRAVARVLDFGVAKFEGDSELTKAGAVVGTPAYMPPEQARGASDVEPAFDIYGVGALLYRMVSGRAPYVLSSSQSVVDQVLRGPPPLPSTLNAQIPSSLESVILKAMARHPTERYPTIMALERDLARLLDIPAAADAPVTAVRRRSFTFALSKEGGMMRWVFYSLALFALFELAASGLSWALDGGAPVGMACRALLASLVGLAGGIKISGSGDADPLTLHTR